MICLSLDVEPMGKPRINGKAGIWSPAAKRYYAWRDEVRAEFPPGFELPAELSLTFLISMPPSWSKKKRAAMLGAPHASTPDIDNACKAFMDCFPEDKHVYSLVAEKYWATEGSIEIEMGDMQ